MDHPASKNICIRASQPSDNEGLTKLTSLAAMQGEIAFRTDRYPNFFRLAAARGQSMTFVAELQEEIVGAASFSQMPVFIGGRETTAFYLADFKVHPAHRKQGITLMLIQLLLEKLYELQADIVFSTSIAGNKAIEKFYAGNDQWPAASFAGRFMVYQLVPRSFSVRSKRYVLQENSPNTDHVAFLNQSMQNHEIAPALSVNMLADSTMLDALLNNERMATLCLCDAGYMKQETLTGLPFPLRLMTRVLKRIGRILPVITLPVENEEMKILYIRTFACRKGHE
jgi:predicted N-acetyltransferase YhbS